MKKLLLIDDEFIFRQGLKYMMDWEAPDIRLPARPPTGRRVWKSISCFSLT